MQENNVFNQNCINHLATVLFEECRDRKPLCSMHRRFKTMPKPTSEMLRAGIMAGAIDEKQAEKIFNEMTRCYLRESFRLIKKLNI